MPLLPCWRFDGLLRARSFGRYGNIQRGDWVRAHTDEDNLGKPVLKDFDFVRSSTFDLAAPPLQ
jgi:hypothetical protein